MAADDAGPPAPTPRRLYVHDDLTEELRAQLGADSGALALAEALLATVARDRERVTILTAEDQAARLAAAGPHSPFELTLAVGRAGEAVARRVHARTGWFPSVRRVDATREEDGRGGYAIVRVSGEPIEPGLAELGGYASLAIVDDTVFSGLTMRTLLGRLPAATRAVAHVFCLRAVAASLDGIRVLCPVTAGFAAPGRLLEDVSFINASGLVRRVAIRRRGRPPLAFFDRPAWIRAWFPDDAEEVLARCRELNALLESSEGASAAPSDASPSDDHCAGAAGA